MRLRLLLPINVLGNLEPVALDDFVDPTSINFVELLSQDPRTLDRIEFLLAQAFKDQSMLKHFHPKEARYKSLVEHRHDLIKKVCALLADLANPTMPYPVSPEAIYDAVLVNVPMLDLHQVVTEARLHLLIQD